MKEQLWHANVQVCYVSLLLYVFHLAIFGAKEYCASVEVVHPFLEKNDTSLYCKASSSDQRLN